MFALSNREESMTLVKDSESSERLWILIHSDLGPYLVGAWYRPPVQGEMETIKSLRAEWEELSQEAVGTILVGDMNIHHKKWLRRSDGNTAEGEKLYKFWYEKQGCSSW